MIKIYLLICTNATDRYIHQWNYKHTNAEIDRESWKESRYQIYNATVT